MWPEIFQLAESRGSGRQALETRVVGSLGVYFRCDTFGNLPFIWGVRLFCCITEVDSMSRSPAINLSCSVAPIIFPFFFFFSPGSLNKLRNGDGPCWGQLRPCRASSEPRCARIDRLRGEQHPWCTLRGLGPRPGLAIELKGPLPGWT